jgi:hypothetical protein
MIAERHPPALLIDVSARVKVRALSNIEGHRCCNEETAAKLAAAQAQVSKAQMSS